MSAELWILTATAVLAVVAISAALIAVRAARQISRNAAPPAVAQPLVEPAPTLSAERSLAPHVAERAELIRHHDAALEPRIVEGRLIVPPTQEQVLTTALSRPGVRLSVYAHGIAHALRAESRDRISALIRREYRRRRRVRLLAGRRAARSTTPTAPISTGDEWLGS